MMGECRVAAGARPSAVWAMLFAMASAVSGYPRRQGARPEEVNQTSDSQRQGPSDYLDNYQIPGEASVSTEEEQCEEVEAVEYEGDITRTVKA